MLTDNENSDVADSSSLESICSDSDIKDIDDLDDDSFHDEISLTAKKTYKKRGPPDGKRPNLKAN